MRIARIEDLHCDAGWRVFSFLKLTTDEGLTGISEYNACYGSPGLTGVIERLAAMLVGRNPCSHEHLSQQLYAMTRQASGGMTQQAIAAIENALLDLKAKSLGVPVYELLGGAVRDRLPLYWSHCGTYRMNESSAQAMNRPRFTRLSDVVALGKEVYERGFNPRGHACLSGEQAGCEKDFLRPHLGEQTRISATWSHASASGMIGRK